MRGSHYLCPINKRLTYSYLLAIANEQYSIKVNCTAFSYTQAVYFYSLPWCYLILFAAGFDNSVNLRPPEKLILSVIEGECQISPLHPLSLGGISAILY